MIRLAANLSLTEADALAHVLARLAEHDIGRRGLRLADSATQQAAAERALAELRTFLRVRAVGPY